MKKTLVSALTTALVVGAASTTFAAANPFADVPADHWAYDAVSELQAKGVVNGYAVDNTFRGNQNMTRYEMAQIVAKAMAKVESGDAATKAMVDKLAAEFRDELANLGVRMDDLEARMDNVKHSGFIRYRYARNTGDFDGVDPTNIIRFRLNSAVKINDKVDGFARFETDHSVNHDATSDNNRLERLWVHGKVGTTNIYAGKINPHDAVTSLGHGIMLDGAMTGAQVTFNKGAVSWTIDAGTTHSTDAYGNAGIAGVGHATKIVGTHVDYKKGNFDAAIGYYNFSNKDGLREIYNADFAHWGVWGIGLGYKFGKDFYLTGDYVRANKAVNNAAGEQLDKDGWNVQLNYKGAKESQPKSWGAYVGYQKLSPTATPFPTYDTVFNNNTKGWKVGVDYTFMKNIVGSIQYFDGKVIKGGQNDKARRISGQVTFSF
ncbi:S-layer homology domain-containing protein [Anaerovibrio lipolyticus DSM 3074]|uniref:S-layer homology domain-containing protein n=1 Tax=Anaerovibrio lipolyticus DSM 3074 TaxID=1120997 RepID=A0A1M6FMP2_9FIRM|nr:putative porin [Anaerovibrio lipolyticus]SHI98952.1 S-layer homology domain-containing protein [Anaerovibrio lipolyticus DSM 3074]